jgi:hypothetical protein
MSIRSRPEKLPLSNHVSLSSHKVYKRKHAKDVRDGDKRAFSANVIPSHISADLNANSFRAENISPPYSVTANGTTSFIPSDRNNQKYVHVELVLII